MTLCIIFNTGAISAHNWILSQHKALCTHTSLMVNESFFFNTKSNSHLKLESNQENNCVFPLKKSDTGPGCYLYVLYRLSAFLALVYLLKDKCKAIPQNMVITKMQSSNTCKPFPISINENSYCKMDDVLAELLDYCSD